MELNKGSRLGNRFKVLGCVGSGKMGTVFVAADAASADKIVALKVFHQQLLKDSSTRKKLRERIAVIQEIHDDKIVEVAEYIDEQGLEALALEYVPGGNLHSLVEDGALSVSEIVEVLRQTAQALTILHDRGIMHWDLKPTSILFSKQGQVKLSGFGASKVLSCGPINLKVGTAQYRAPEYLRHGDCDQRGDIYSLGIIGYELVCGSIPASADDDADGKTYSAPNAWPPTCPPAIREVIEKAMAPNPLDRFQTVREFETALVRARDNRSASPHTKGSLFLCFFSLYVGLLLGALHTIFQ